MWAAVAKARVPRPSTASPTSCQAKAHDSFDVSVDSAFKDWFLNLRATVIERRTVIDPNRKIGRVNTVGSWVSLCGKRRTLRLQSCNL